MIPTILAIVIVPFAAGEAQNRQPIQQSAVVDAPLKAVWDAYTTSEGITSWMVTKGTVDLRIGGEMRTTYSKDVDVNGPGAIVNTITSFDPERMISIRCTQTPPKFPFKKTIVHVWTVLYFRPVDAKKTEVTCRMLGWDGSEASNKMRHFFKAGNQEELNELVKHFKKG